MNIRCSTLFNITKTGITQRRAPLGSSNETEWHQKRSMQANLDTIIQVISLRAQPENITDPVETIINLEKLERFGFLLNCDEPVKMWSFKFYVNYGAVFENSEHELGGLYNDCEQVPMIKLDEQIKNLTAFLDTSPELRNIYFEVIRDE